MLRTALLAAWLTSVAMSLPALVVAQDHTSSSRQPSADAGHARGDATAPALFTLAQNNPRNLVDRLKMLQGGNDGERRGSSRRAASRPSAAPGAPAAPAPVVSKSTGNANSGGTGARTGDPASQLPSVLVRGGRSKTKSPAKATSPAGAESRSPAATAETALGDTARAPEANSSRRTARRWRSPRTSAYHTSAFQESPSTSSSTGGSDKLSLSEQGPILRVEAAGPDRVTVGETATYRIRLLNPGDITAEQVAVTAAVPASVQIASAQSRLGKIEEATDPATGHRIIWTMDRISAGSQHELTIDVKPTENQPLKLKIDWVYRPTPLTAHVEVQQPQLAVNVEGPEEMRFGETKVFKIRLSNPGNGPANDVAVNVTATGSGEQSEKIGTLGPGESRVLDVELAAKKAGDMQVHVQAHGAGNLRAESGQKVLVRQAVLAVDVSAPELIYAGTTAAYEIRVANRGDATAEDVIMQVELPVGATNGMGVDKKPITRKQPKWRVGDLGPNAERVYSMQCDLNANGENQLVVGVQGDGDCSASDQAVTAVKAIADLKLTVNDPKGPVRIGHAAEYEITVLNRGSKEASNVSLVAQFSEGIEPVSVAGHPAEIVPGQVIFEPMESVPAGGQVSLKITAKASQSGNLRFRAELDCGTPETKLVAEENTRFYGAAAGASAPRSASRSPNQPTPARR